MNFTALAPPPDTQTDTQNIAVHRPSGGWKLSDRWAWAFSLPVSGIARAVAGVVAFHAHDKTGLSWPGMGTIERESGFGRTAIIAAIKVLEQGGHLTVRRFRIGRKNVANRYQLPPMGNVSASHPSAPDGLGGSAPDGPELVRTELVSTKAARSRCAACGYSWPAEFGKTCYRCLRDPPRPLPAPERPKTALTEASEDQLRAVGWRKGKGKEGTWTRTGNDVAELAETRY